MQSTWGNADVYQEKVDKATADLIAAIDGLKKKQSGESSGSSSSGESSRGGSSSSKKALTTETSSIPETQGTWFSYERGWKFIDAAGRAFAGRA